MCTVKRSPSLVGAVLGLLALLAIVVAAVAWCYVRRQRRKTVWGEYRVAEPVKAAAADDVWGGAGAICLPGPLR